MFKPFSENEMTIRQKMDFAESLIIYPALTAMVVFRRNLGYRLLHPQGFLAACLAMAVISLLSWRQTPNAGWLLIFAALVFFGGVCQRVKRWWQLRRGLQLHTYYVGDSVMAGWRWPGFLKRERRIERLLDPTACLGIGVLVFQVSHPLGAWLAVSSVCLFFTEDMVRRREFERDLDAQDSLIESDAIRPFPSGGTSHDSDSHTITLSSGMAADVQRNIQARKRKGRGPKS